MDLESLTEELTQLEAQHQAACNMAQQTAGCIIYLRNKIAQLTEIVENKTLNVPEIEGSENGETICDDA